MNNITTLENVFQRVDVMFQTCHDSFIPVPASSIFVILSPASIALLSLRNRRYVFLPLVQACCENFAAFPRKAFEQ